MNEAVYRGYAADRLERQYNSRLSVPDHGTVAMRNAERSEAYRNEARSHSKLDVAYGPSAGETLDLFLPEKKGAPVHMFIHGGYWRSRDKREYSFLAKPLVKAGAAVAIVNYDLCPVLTLDEVVRQLRAACCWLYDHVADYGGDPDRIHVSGNSAGGHLTAMMVATGWSSFAGGKPRDLVKSGVAISGIYELAPLLFTSINDDVRLDAEAAERNSPIRLAPPSASSISVTVGGAETDEFRRQARDFADAWTKAGATVEFFEMPGLNHFTILAGLDDPANRITRTILGRMGLGGGD